MVIEYDFEKKELRYDVGEEEWLIPQILGIITEIQQGFLQKWYDGEKALRRKIYEETNTREENKNGRK